MIVDSGCTFHLHNEANDLINVRSCLDIISGLSSCHDTISQARSWVSFALQSLL